jgi:hypothetical protein
MHGKTVGVVLAGLLAFAGGAAAVIGTIDDVPAATLLLPYFEVDLNNPNGITTLFSVNNASASAAVAHFTLWTDESRPTLDFDVYLTGFDVQTINLRDVFNGNLPRTADAGADPGDTISHQGTLSQDINFPGALGPCGTSSTVYPATGALNAILIDHIRKAHTGVFDPLFGGVLGASYGDNIARGYITMDSVTSCNLSFPADPGYFTSLADNRNILWGDYFYVNPRESFAAGETLVHIEACNVPSVGNGAGHCPFSFGDGDYTFYGRYFSFAGQDQREPLATTFATRYVNGGGFDGGTDLIVWRDSKTRGASFPLNQGEVVAFDENENATGLCFSSDNVSPASAGSQSCFPLETQRVHLRGGNVIAADAIPPAAFGWLYLNLNHSLASGDPYPGRAQAWVTVNMSAEGRYEVGYDAIQLDNATSSAPGGVVLIH